MKILMAAITATIIIVFVLWCLWRIFVKFDDWARSDPTINDVCDYGHWKFLHGFHATRHSKDEAMIRRMYEEERNN